MLLAAYLIPAKENTKDSVYKTALWNLFFRAKNDSKLQATLDRFNETRIANLFAK